jgi:hypothetical protein
MPLLFLLRYLPMKCVAPTNVEICAIESFDIPEYSDQETAVESLSRMSIPDEDRASTWKYQEMFQ